MRIGNDRTYVLILPQANRIACFRDRRRHFLDGKETWGERNDLRRRSGRHFLPPSGQRKVLDCGMTEICLDRFAA